MSQRQKEPQAADGQPPAGPNGELQFQPEAQKPEVKGKYSEIYVIYIYICVCVCVCVCVYGSCTHFY